jgi:hypothetical protein
MSHNTLYSTADGQALLEKLDDIMKEVDIISQKKLTPTQDQMWSMIYVVRDFVKEKKRKIYGGFALNKLIESVDPRDKFYSDDDVKSWDIDFYSPDPIGDAKEIAKRLHEKGFCHVQARMAQHDETYKVFAETNDCADITYVPRNIYNKIPFKEIDGMVYTGPHFMMIDYFRVITDPLTSYFRLDKTFTRLCLMMKHYTLPHITSAIDIIPPDRDLDIALHAIHTFLIGRESTIIVGMYAYNHFIKESGIIERTKEMKRSAKDDKKYKNVAKINFVDINYYEIVSTQYKSDTRDLILTLQDKFPTNKTKITYRENYPFFQYLGFNVDIYCDNEIVCRVYHYNYRCVPFLNVPALYFKKASYDEEKGNVRLGTLATQMMYNLINVMRARTNNDLNTKNLYYTMISHTIDMKNYYFGKTGKTIFDESLFQEFILRCVGMTYTPQMEKAIRFEKRMKHGKRISWSFNPKIDTDHENVYTFKNSSGNPIKNDKNKKINLSSKGTCENEDDYDENDEDSLDSHDEANDELQENDKDANRNE